jgi:hypothetical protein|tara:strand:+ start:3649 stop:4593 length:945 start_codon:yes stop_codon:yes gene_type:complete
MSYALTLFGNIYDNKTHKDMSFSSLEKFEKLLYDLSKQPGYKPKKGEFKKGSPLISPAAYVKGETRKNVNVTKWSKWAALDVDEYDTTFEEAIAVFKGHYFICYSSASSTKEHPKFRIVFPLAEEVPADKIRHFWYALNTEFNSLGDKQTKDLSRMYYVPAQYPDAYNFIFTHKAPLLNAKILMEQHTFVDKSTNNSFGSQFPESIQKELDAYRQTKLTNTSYKWSSYRDCPFVNKTLINEYMTIGEGGWYSKMYTIMMSISANSIRRGYPITPDEVERLVREIDMDTGGWYKNRPVKLEAKRAIDFALRSVSS